MITTSVRKATDGVAATSCHGESMRYRTELPRNPAAPALARRSLTQWYGDALEFDELYRAKLLVSELVTNAVLHGEGSIRLSADLDDDRVLVEVRDQGSGFEHQLHEIQFGQVHGRGLSIVDAESSRWGIHEGIAHVWFEIERTAPQLSTQRMLGD